MDDKIKKMTEARKGVRVESNPVKKFFSSEKRSKSMAIKAMCAFCMGCDSERMEAGFRTDIKNCTSVKCPLHEFRPYQ